MLMLLCIGVSGKLFANKLEICQCCEYSLFLLPPGGQKINCEEYHKETELYYVFSVSFENNPDDGVKIYLGLRGRRS